jgi:hypothetical protein
MEDRKPKIDLKDAESILQLAKAHLDKGESIKAISTAKKANKVVDKTTEDFKEAVGAVENTRRVIEDAKSAGIKTQEAEEFLNKANSALISGTYMEVHPMTRKSYTALQSASIVPGRDVSVNTIIMYDQGKTTLSVTVENNTEFHVRTLKLKPDFSNTPFLQEGEKSLSLKPNKEEKVIYELTPTSLPGTEGGESPIIGKEITLETSLRPIAKENRIIYVVWVTNNTAEAITGLKITPNLPEILIPDAPVKIIDQILPSEKKQVVFELALQR